MFGIDSTVLAFVALAGFSAGAVAYAFLFNTIANETQGRQAPRDRSRTAETDRSVVKARRDRLAEAAKRRKSVQDSLKELDDKQKAKDVNIKKPPLQGPASAGRHDGHDRALLHLFRRLRRRPHDRRLSSLGAPLLVAARRRCSPAGSVCRAGSSPSGAARRVKAFLERVPERARHHRARRQVRPAAQRRHPADRQRSARAGARPSSAASSSPSRSACRCPKPRCACPRPCRARRPASSASSSRSRARPAAICRRRWAICRACCATARR